MEDIYTQLALAVATIISAFIAFAGKAIVTFINSKKDLINIQTSTEQIKLKETIIENVIKAINQEFSDMSNNMKKESAVNTIAEIFKSKKLPIDETMIRSYVEAKVSDTKAKVVKEVENIITEKAKEFLVK